MREFDNIIDHMPKDLFYTIDPTPCFTNGDRTLIERNGFPLYSDNGHITRKGAELLRPLFEPFFQDFSIDKSINLLTNNNEHFDGQFLNEKINLLQKLYNLKYYRSPE